MASRHCVTSSVHRRHHQERRKFSSTMFSSGTLFVPPERRRSKLYFSSKNNLIAQLFSSSSSLPGSGSSGSRGKVFFKVRSCREASFVLFCTTYFCNEAAVSRLSINLEEDLRLMSELLPASSYMLENVSSSFKKITIAHKNLVVVFWSPGCAC